jgi:hypothetical protein
MLDWRLEMLSHQSRIPIKLGIRSALKMINLETTIEKFLRLVASPVMISNC